MDIQFAVQRPAVPAFESVRRHRDGREGGRRLALQEAETLRHLVRDQVAQGHVVAQHDQTDGGAGDLLVRAHRHVAGDHRNLALEVHAPLGGLGGKADRIAGTEEAIRGALVHERIGPETLRHGGTARAADQLDMVEIGGAVQPLIGARQRRGAGGLIERLALAFDPLGEPAQAQLVRVPVIERGLHRRHVGWQEASEIARDHDEPSVAAVLQRGELHDQLPSGVPSNRLRRPFQQSA